MIMWAGYDGTDVLNTGGRYNPGTRRLDGYQHHQCSPCSVSSHGIWTGSEMIVWGGAISVNLQYTSTGGRYCAQSGPSPSPTPTPTASPSATRNANGYFNANSNSYGYSHSQSNTDWNANRNPYWNTDNNSNAK